MSYVSPALETVRYLDAEAAIVDAGGRLLLLRRIEPFV
jgi:hypothetical protein